MARGSDLSWQRGAALANREGEARGASRAGWEGAAHWQGRGWQGGGELRYLEGAARGRRPCRGVSGLARFELEAGYVKPALWMEGKKSISQPKLTRQ